MSAFLRVGQWILTSLGIFQLGQNSEYIPAPEAKKGVSLLGLLLLLVLGIFGYVYYKARRKK